MRDVNVVYNQEQAPLEMLLRSIDRPGDYCTQGRLLVPMPRVDVEGARPLSFPVTEEQARSLIDAAERAPYGRGELTLVDSSVRACWQIDAAKVKVTGGAWDDTLAQVVARASTGLGCPPERTAAHPYKLLVYEPGGFFAPHRDTEKVDGMVATLVLSLPVAGTGGELVIRHKERETVVALHTEEPSELAFAAFYADCVHETRPVTAGYRIVLVYHLVLQGAAAATWRNAPHFGSQEERIAVQLRNWEASSAAGDKLVWLLEHDYSEEGLSFDVLKNADAAVGRVLVRAAGRANHALYAAILDIYESGTVEDFGDSDYWDEPDDEDWEEVDDEMFDSTRSLLGWIAPDGSQPDYGELPLLPGELLPAGVLDGVKPDDQDVTVTGNEGVQLSRSYRRAALVLWPLGRTVGTLARGGIEGAVAWFADDVARSEHDTRSRARLPALAAQLIDAWPAPDPARFYHRHDTDGVQNACRDALRLLRRLADEATTRRFLREVATPHYSGGENDELLATAAAIAPATLHAWLPEFAAANLPPVPVEVLDLLWRLCPHDRSAAERDHLRPALVDAARAVCRALPAAVGSDDDRKPVSHPYGYAMRREQARPLSARAIGSLFALAWYCALAEEAEAAAMLLVQRPAVASPDRALPQALAKLAELRDVAGGAGEPAGFATLWRHGSAFLLARSAAPPEEPGDWAIETRVPCACDHCRRLQAFCAAPATTTVRFSMRQDLRQHVETMIARLRLDIRCETERKGSPHTLICTKTRATYERRCTQYAEDVAHMRLLIAAAPQDSAANAAVYASDLQQLRTAIARQAADEPQDR